MQAASFPKPVHDQTTRAAPSQFRLFAVRRYHIRSATVLNPRLIRSQTHPIIQPRPALAGSLRCADATRPTPGGPRDRRRALYTTARELAQLLPCLAALITAPSNSDRLDGKTARPDVHRIPGTHRGHCLLRHPRRRPHLQERPHAPPAQPCQVSGRLGRRHPRRHQPAARPRRPRARCRARRPVGLIDPRRRSPGGRASCAPPSTTHAPTSSRGRRPPGNRLRPLCPLCAHRLELAPGWYNHPESADLQCRPCTAATGEAVGACAVEAPGPDDVVEPLVDEHGLQRVTAREARPFSPRPRTCCICGSIAATSHPPPAVSTTGRACSASPTSMPDSPLRAGCAAPRCDRESVAPVEKHPMFFA